MDLIDFGRWIVDLRHGDSQLPPEPKLNRPTRNRPKQCILRLSLSLWTLMPQIQARVFPSQIAQAVLIDVTAAPVDEVNALASQVSEEFGGQPHRTNARLN